MWFEFFYLFLYIFEELNLVNNKMRFIRMKAVSLLNSHLIDYPTPIVGYLSSFGSLSGLCLVIQIFTGILLAAHYTPHVTLAFASIEHIMRDVNDG
jgi:ubiquinol-cytochrome c reductase cytochrome b subunit